MVDYLNYFKLDFKPLNRSVAGYLGFTKMGILNFNMNLNKEKSKRI